MKKTLITAISSVVLAVGGGQFATAADMPAATYEAPVPAGASDGAKIGYLDCTIDGGVGYVFGSAKTMNCTFQPTVGEKIAENYSGTVRKVGVDLGFTTGSRLIWAVFAPTAGYHQGSLGGLYQGATAEATVGIGVGTNILYGGTSRSIHLQPVSLTGQVGLNLAATATSVTLDAVN